MKLDYIVSPTENLTDVRTLYSDHLGLEVAPETGDFVLITVDEGPFWAFTAEHRCRSPTTYISISEWKMSIRRTKSFEQGCWHPRPHRRRQNGATARPFVPIQPITG